MARTMLPAWAVRLLCSLCLLATSAHVQAHAAAPIDDAAPSPRGADWDAYGTARLRWEGLTNYPADASGWPAPRQQFGSGFVRAGGRWQPSTKLSLDLELEAINGYWWGDVAELGRVATASPYVLARDGIGSLSLVLPRKASLTFRDALGAFSVGVQNWGWGAGILSNSGDQDPIFGDARQGNVVARIGGALTPWGGAAPTDLLRGFALFAAADYILRDDNAQALRGDLAFGGQGGFLWRTRDGVAGALLGVRYQRDRVEPTHPVDANPWLLVLPADVYAKKRFGSDAVPVALTLEGEAALLVGRTNRTYSDEAQDGADILSHGAYTSMRVDVKPARLRFAFDASYASGDADPRDDRVGQFTLHSDHNVGFILFEEVLPTLSARAADLVAAPGLVGTPAPGLRHTISQGGVQNALAFHPYLRWRPWGTLDARLGYLLAYAVVPPVDLYATAKQGGYPRGIGGSTGRAYGQEVDASLRGTLPLPGRTSLELGAEAGLFLPGDAFAAAALGPVASVRGRVDFRW